VVEMSGPTIRQDFSSAYLCRRFLRLVLRREFQTTETDGQVRSNQWTEKRTLSRKDFQRIASEYDSNGSSMELALSANRCLYVRCRYK